MKCCLGNEVFYNVHIIVFLLAGGLQEDIACSLLEHGKINVVGYHVFYKCQDGFTIKI